MRTFCALTALLLSIPPAPAPAETKLLSCEACTKLPAGLEIPLEICRAEPPLLPDKTVAAVPASVDVGRLFEFPAAEDTRLWVGVSQRAVPYVAAFEAGSKVASWCRSIGGFDEVAAFEGQVRISASEAGIPLVRLYASVRLGASGSLIAHATVARLGLTRQWVVVRAYSDSIASGEPGVPSAEDKLRLGRKLTIEKGVQAAQAEDFVIALKRLHEALPDHSASVHLGFLLHGLGRDADAEPLLLEVANTGDTGPWLALGDLYWKAGLRPLATAAYRQYLAELPHASSRRDGDPASTPVARAVERSKPAP